MLKSIRIFSRCYMKHIFIINPSAGKKDFSTELIQQIQQIYTKEEVLIHITEKKGEATSFIQHLDLQEEVCFYSCGGDGTLHEVVNGMVHHKNARLAIVPIGTGNDFIKSFSNLTKEDFLDLKKIKEGVDLPCDLLCIDDRIYCLNVISVGLDAAIAQSVIHFKKLPFVNGIVAYYLALVLCFFTSMRNEYKAKIDDVVLEKQPYIFAVIGNGKYYGGGFHPTPLAKINSGVMDICMIKTISRLRFLRLIQVYKEGKHLPYKDIVVYQSCKTFQLFHDQPLRLSVDGEIYDRKDPCIRIVPSAITLRLPKQKDKIDWGE